MLPLARFTDSLKLLLLAATVAMVTLLNQRQVALLQQVPPASEQQAEKVSEESSTRKTVVYQKVCFEATPSIAVPLPLAAVLPFFFTLPAVTANAVVSLAVKPVQAPAVALQAFSGCALLARAP